MVDRMSVRIVDWNGDALAHVGDDVDSFIRREGPAAFRRLIAHAIPSGDWIILQRERAITTDTDVLERAAIVSRLLPIVRRETDPIIRSHYRQRLAAVGRVSEAVIARMVGDRMRPESPVLSPDDALARLGRIMGGSEGRMPE